MRILLVEDHGDSARAVELYLRQHGHDVDVAATAGEAYQLCVVGRGGYDLLVCDIGLPDVDGWSLMARVRRACDVPAIALSGYGGPAAARRSEEVGFLAHLAKPVELGALHAAIHRAAGRRGRGADGASSSAAGPPAVTTTPAPATPGRTPSGPQPAAGLCCTRRRFARVPRA